MKFKSSITLKEYNIHPQNISYYTNKKVVMVTGKVLEPFKCIDESYQKDYFLKLQTNYKNNDIYYVNLCHVARVEAQDYYYNIILSNGEVINYFALTDAELKALSYEETESGLDY